MRSILFALTALAATLPGLAAALDCAPDRVTVMADQGPVTYSVEIADEPQEQARGLMFRASMPRDHGMLFVFPGSAPRAFWMKNTILPLDIVFIDAEGRVVNVAEHTTPFSEASIPSTGDALAVLELNAGEAAAHGIGPGTQLVNPAFTAAPPRFHCTD